MPEHKLIVIKKLGEITAANVREQFTLKNQKNSVFFEN
jgi:hypothetical protein